MEEKVKKIIIIAAIVCAALVGFGAVKAGAQQESWARFSVYPETTDFLSRDVTIVVDNETGVMYLAYEYYRGAGLTVMLDADGKPLIWEGE